MTRKIKQRLEYLRAELRAERISYGELAELQDLASHIPAGDVELREAAGLPESFPITLIGDPDHAAKQKETIRRLKKQ